MGHLRSWQAKLTVTSSKGPGKLQCMSSGKRLWIFCRGQKWQLCLCNKRHKGRRAVDESRQAEGAAPLPLFYLVPYLAVFAGHVFLALHDSMYKARSLVSQCLHWRVSLQACIWLACKQSNFKFPTYFLCLSIYFSLFLCCDILEESAFY